MKLGISELFRKNSKKEEPADAASVSENTEEGADANIKDEKPVDDMIECPKCKQKFKKADIKENMNVCMACGYHFVIPADRRVRFLVDPGTFRPLKCRVAFSNPLNYPDYEEKIKALQEKTGMEEAVYTGVGSMGMAVGEKITNAFEYADKKKLPVIIFTASGGARMQEGIISLMQMAKTSAAVERFNKHGGLYISVLTHPTTGGVTASFATLGDIILAEPEALIGFAGPRVIEQTIGEKLPEGFQRSEFQEEHGFVDQIVPRDKMREVLAHILRLHCKRGR